MAIAGTAEDYGEMNQMIATKSEKKTHGKEDPSSVK